MKILAPLLLFFALFSIQEKGVSLVGTTPSLQHQNKVADLEGLTRVRDDEELEVMKASGQLVTLPTVVNVDERLDPKWWWCLPQTAMFLEDIGGEFREVFGKPLQINSAIRTVVRQLELLPQNANAAPVSGDRASPHLTGATVDIAKKGLSRVELNWIREKLLYFEAENLIEATEEQFQLVFHVMVYNTYLSYRAERK